MSKSKGVYLYVETTSDEAVELIENLTAVRLARRLLDETVLPFDDIGEIQQALRDLERGLRRRMRKEILQPDAVRVSKHLAKRLKQEIKKENDTL